MHLVPAAVEKNTKSAAERTCKKENIEQQVATRCFPEGRKNRFLTSFYYRQRRNYTLTENRLK